MVKAASLSTGSDAQVFEQTGVGMMRVGVELMGREIEADDCNRTQAFPPEFVFKG